MNNCDLCPRECMANRSDGELGYCGVSDTVKVAYYGPHRFEEPVLSGTNGAGAVFFSGCSLRCVYCQNYDLSHSAKGNAVTLSELQNMMLELAEKSVHCIDLVTPTHYADKLVYVLEEVRPKINIPIVWNTGGYEKVQTLKMLDGLVDIYLPDLKYVSPELSKKYSDAENYCETATAALSEMYRQTGKCVIGDDGLMKRGVLIRHMVLPGCRHDSIAVLDRIAKTVPTANVRLSLMSQYTPDFAKNSPHRELHRRITRFEYMTVLHHAEELGFDGFYQDRSSANIMYTPDFN